MIAQIVPFLHGGCFSDWTSPVPIEHVAAVDRADQRRRLPAYLAVPSALLAEAKVEVMPT